MSSVSQVNNSNNPLKELLAENRKTEDAQFEEGELLSEEGQEANTVGSGVANAIETDDQEDDQNNTVSLNTSHAQRPDFAANQSESDADVGEAASSWQPPSSVFTLSASTTPSTPPQSKAPVSGRGGAGVG